MTSRLFFGSGSSISILYKFSNVLEPNLWLRKSKEFFNVLLCDITWQLLQNKLQMTLWKYKYRITIQFGKLFDAFA